MCGVSEYHIELQAPQGRSGGDLESRKESWSGERMYGGGIIESRLVVETLSEGWPGWHLGWQRLL